jgi:putative hydrolase of the HAD superfamily
MARPYRGVLFDLFGTLIAFDRERLPEAPIRGELVRTTVGGLVPVLARCVPEVSPEQFLEALFTVSEEMSRARLDGHVELPSRERFRRALERVGCPDPVQAEAAAALSRAHMTLIAGATVLPDGHAALLTALRPHYRLGLVSNFDDSAAAYGILHRHGLLPHLEAIVISESVGLRKPHPALLRVGLAELGLAPGEVLFVGDTWAEDIAAARAAGVDAAWIDARGQGVPDGATPPRYVLRALTELGAILG